MNEKKEPASSNRFLLCKCVQMSTYLIRSCLICIFNITSQTLVIQTNN